MKITTVELENGMTLAVGAKINIKYFPIVDDEEDKENPITKTIQIERFEPTDDGSLIKIVGDDGECYFDENVVDYAQYK